ncbi:hypothetical protein N7463_001519, partial [Penicillium fimorum]
LSVEEMPPPRLNVPPGSCASIKMIDNNSRLANIPTAVAFGPPISNFEYLPAFPSFSFLIENSQRRKVLYDLAIRPDWRNLSPVTVNRLEATSWRLSADSHVIDILKENGVAGKDVEAIIWSHWHWDHLGDPSTFPASTDLVVGPGFKSEFLPGYPTDKDSPILENDYEGRRLIELDFSDECIKIGGMNAYDYFGDGSFYLLDAPGHAIGHLCGLVRTTTIPDTFIFLAGDAVHHAAELRPSEHLPIPNAISPHPIDSLVSTGSFCPGHILEDLQISRGLSPGTPFFNPMAGYSPADIISTLSNVQNADCTDNIFVIFSHDTHVSKIVDLFPLSLNQWKLEGWGELAKWKFLQDFESVIRSNSNKLKQ